MIIIYFQREGFSKFNKIYEFKYLVNGQQCDMVFTSVSGHLLGLDYEEKYRKWYSCDPLDLFDLPVHKTCKEQSMINIKVTNKRFFTFLLKTPYRVFSNEIQSFKCSA